MTELVLIPSDASATKPTAAEFFAGIGLVRLGLEDAGFEVTWSNDIEPAKKEMYEGHFRDPVGAHTYEPGDIANVKGAQMPDDLALAWASFPCTDLSLAGARRGLAGSESGTFWHFVRVLEQMGDRRPSVVALENVVGLATSHGGEDLAAAIRALNDLDYSVDVLALDARRFVPQSRPRLFLVGALEPPADEPVPNSELRPDWLQAPFGDPSLRTHRTLLPAPPPPMTTGLTELADKVPSSSDLWWDEQRQAAFVSSLSPIQAERLESLRKGRGLSRRTAYRRTRAGKPTWEIRPDDISGCLRTARGGSSKQAVVEAGQGKVRVRWMTPREYAKLMGAADYRLDGLRTNQALFGFGDAVCVPVVAWLGREYLMPLVRGELRSAESRRLAVVGA
ncbi:DNA (cytosine-5-)-methyltransferase [Micromonospora sp. WMMD961]|uniref:DNA cytosine methyltransferase n=1 Tax=Micromonospora sp. WMMD961 TaxID=3016100 RepID=UPI002416A774|nr:DNA (cytosine-5-)-methyltransferase [Micromonospora sp. WMMD961]MDG4778951.1 DNA (cytosine-5-)-methyltransferase [Micromonospora sp. WMMD961]